MLLVAEEPQDGPSMRTRPLPPNSDHQRLCNLLGLKEGRDFLIAIDSKTIKCRIISIGRMGWIEVDLDPVSEGASATWINLNQVSWIRPSDIAQDESTNWQNKPAHDNP